MDILFIAISWAREEIFASKFFIFAGLIFLALSIGFWQLGRSEIARSYIVPTLICSALLFIIGIGLVFNDSRRLRSFQMEYHNNPKAFIESEIERSEKTSTSSYTTIYRYIPLLIIAAALLIIFVEKPIVRASCITIIAMLSVLLFVDSTAQSRISTYNSELRQFNSK